VSLRLRILLLVAAVNVGVLLLVVQLGLSTVGETAPVGVDALAEAHEYAHAERPEDFRGRFVSFLLRRARGRQDFEAYGTEAFADPMQSAEERLRQHLKEGRSRFFYDRDGLMVLDTSRAARWEAYYVGFNDEARREALSGLRSVYLLLCAGTLALIAGTYLVLRRLVLRPVEQLAAASRAAAAGRRPEPIPLPRGRSEVVRLIENFNRMAQEVYEYQYHLEDRVRDALSRVTAAEARLVVAQRLAATGTLAAGFAHEINNPLGGILNALRKVREGGLPPAKRDEYFDIVQDGLDRIRTIVERILHFTPAARGPAPLDAAMVCRKAVELSRHRAEKRGVEMTLEVPAPLPHVVGDAQELTQAVLNLLFNAIDAIPEGREGHVRVLAREEGREVVLEVVDDGVGMDPETRRRCVDLFFSTKPEGQGTGLGLGIVQHIVTDHGGVLDIESEEARGTTVRIRLPLTGTS
jgi:signal transduction histidine kinase